jgi:hypothetical protein
VASFQLTVNGREHHVDVPSGTHDNIVAEIDAQP